MRLEVRLLIRQQLGQSLLRRCSSVSATIISRMAAMRVASKNMCSVRHRPMPSAPNFTACCRVVRVVGVGADAQLAGRVRPAHEASRNRRRRKRQRSGSPRRTPCRWSRRCEIQSPSWKTTSPMVERSWLLRQRAARRSRQRSRCPCRGQRRPRGRSCRRGRSGCPAHAPCPRYLPERSPDERERPSCRSWRQLVASSAVKYTMPQAAPGEAARPMAISFAFFSATASNCGCSRESSCFGSTLQNGLVGR